MSTPRAIRKARKSDPWATTVRQDLADQPEFRWTEQLPTGDATELPYADGMRQFELARRLWTEPDDINDDFVERT